MNKTLLIVMLMLTTAMSGCLSDEVEPKDEIPMLQANFSHMESYQFHNVQPIAIGNQTVAEVNATNVSVVLNITIESMFHEPLAWDQGFVNVSILDENETVLWHNESSNDEINYTLSLDDHNGNLTFRVMAEGSDSQLDNVPGDWYIISYNLTYYWREA